jgi:serine phosphatase RsbU (regulator of sigma subunit)
MTHDTRRTRAIDPKAKDSAELLRECRLRLSEAEAEIERLTAVMDLAKQINTELDTEKVLDGAMKAAVKLTGAERGYLVLTDDGGEQTVRASYHFDRGEVDDRDVTYSHSVVLEAICSGEPILSTNAAEDERFANAASVMTNDLRAIMAAPIRDVGGEPIGAFYVDDPFRAGRFNKQALKLLEGFADQVSSAIRTARLHRHLLKEKERALQMSMARLVQRKLIPQQAPELDGVEMAWTYRPAQEVGGDIVQFLSLPGGECGVFIADVAGKGVPAALVMAKIHQACKMISKVWSGPRAFMAELNDTLREDFDLGTFVTAAIAVFGQSGDTVRIVRAGHCPLGLVRAGAGSFEWLVPDGIALGIVKAAGREFSAEEVVLSLEPGDGLLLYTDGVTEAHCPRKTEYGEERLTAFAERALVAAPDDFVRGLVVDIQAFVGDADQHDDVTILYARRAAAEGGSVHSAPVPVAAGEGEAPDGDPCPPSPPSPTRGGPLRRDGNRFFFDDASCGAAAARSGGGGSEAEAHPDAEDERELRA